MLLRAVDSYNAQLMGHMYALSHVARKMTRKKIAYAARHHQSGLAAAPVELLQPLSRSAMKLLQRFDGYGNAAVYVEGVVHLRHEHNEQIDE
mmetsp:Transcript_15129/g.28792  ORF Transcript_15129/g.28792 Transcript_15129/m.28792 type:complete len:92 (-) Transcript_15129:806-1081(-)